MSIVVIGNKALPKKSVPDKTRAAIEKFVGAGAKPTMTDHSHGPINLFEMFDWRYLVTIPDSQNLIMRIQTDCARKCCNGAKYQQISRRDVHAAVVSQVASDTESLARDALGPLQKERLVEMQSQLDNPKAFLVRREVALCRALDDMRLEIEAGLRDKVWGEHEAVAKSVSQPAILSPQGKVQTSIGHSSKVGWVVILGIEAPDSIFVSQSSAVCGEKRKLSRNPNSWTQFLDRVESGFAK